MRIFGMATMPPRAMGMARAVASLAHQADRIIVYGNEYATDDVFRNACGDPPNCLFVPGGSCDMGGAGKFVGLHSRPEWAEDDFYYSVDDDLIYPEGYGSYMADGALRHDAPVTLHGTTFPSGLTRYEDRLRHNCLSRLFADCTEEMGGTGCMCFRPRRIALSLADFRVGCNNDMEFAHAARRQGFSIWCLKHHPRWVRYRVPPGFTIYDDIQKHDFSIMLSLARKLNAGLHPIPEEPAAQAPFKPLTEAVRAEALDRLRAAMAKKGW